METKKRISDPEFDDITRAMNHRKRMTSYVAPVKQKRVYRVAQCPRACLALILVCNDLLVILATVGVLAVMELL